MLIPNKYSSWFDKSKSKKTKYNEEDLSSYGTLPESYDGPVTQDPVQQDAERDRWLREQDEARKTKEEALLDRKYNKAPQGPRKPATRPDGYFDIYIPDNSMNVLMYNLSKRQFQDFVPAIVAGEHSNINLSEVEFDKLYSALMVKKDKRQARNMLVSMLRVLKMKQDGTYKKAGVMDSISGLFRGKEPVDQEEVYLNKVVALIIKYVAQYEKEVKPDKNGKKKIPFWINGVAALKTLGKQTPWVNSEEETLDNTQKDLLLTGRLEKIVGKLSENGLNAKLDYEGRSYPVDLEIFL